MLTETNSDTAETRPVATPSSGNDTAAANRSITREPPIQSRGSDHARSPRARIDQTRRENEHGHPIRPPRDRAAGSTSPRIAATHRERGPPATTGLGSSTRCRSASRDVSRARARASDRRPRRLIIRSSSRAIKPLTRRRSYRYHPHDHSATFERPKRWMSTRTATLGPGRRARPATTAARLIVAHLATPHGKPIVLPALIMSRRVACRIGAAPLAQLGSRGRDRRV